MALQIRVTEDTAGIVLENLATEIQESLVKGYLLSLLHLQGNIRREIFKWIGKTDVRPTGNLARSFQVEFTIGQDQFTGGVFSEAVYARIHEFGGIIHPKRTKMLAFPFPGVHFPIGVGPRDIPDLKWRPGAHPGIAFLGTVRDGRFFPLFILKRFVRIRPKRYLQKAADNSVDKMEEIVFESIIRVIR